MLANNICKIFSELCNGSKNINFLLSIVKVLLFANIFLPICYSWSFCYCLISVKAKLSVIVKFLNFWNLNCQVQEIFKLLLQLTLCHYQVSEVETTSAAPKPPVVVKFMNFSNFVMAKLYFLTIIWSWNNFC